MVMAAAWTPHLPEYKNTIQTSKGPKNYDLATYDPMTYDPATHDPETCDPKEARVQEARGQEAGDREARVREARKPNAGLKSRRAWPKKHDKNAQHFILSED